MPNDAQRKKLCDMLSHAFVEIRSLAPTDGCRASELADVFHNIPNELWRDYFSISFFREAFLLPCLRRWPKGPYDYLAALDEVEDLA